MIQHAISISRNIANTQLCMDSDTSWTKVATLWNGRYILFVGMSYQPAVALEFFLDKYLLF